MKWELYPKNEELRTSLPLSVELTSWSGNPEVIVDKIGKLELKKEGELLRANFYLTSPGTYQLEVRDGVTIDRMKLEIVEHQYLNFSNEFGFFFILFLIVMGGIFLWTRKIMKN